MSCSNHTKHCGSPGCEQPSGDAGDLTGTSWRIVSGTLTRAKCSFPCESCTTTARLTLRLEMWGNGRPGSKARGVMTGNTFSRKYASMAARCSWLRTANSRMCKQWCERAGRRSLRTNASTSPLRDRTSLLIRSNASVGVRPSIPGSWLPAACCMSPATRTIKNSSMLDCRIAMNFTRSSSGFRESTASSNTLR